MKKSRRKISSGAYFFVFALILVLISTTLFISEIDFDIGGGDNKSEKRGIFVVIKTTFEDGMYFFKPVYAKVFSIKK